MVGVVYMCGWGVGWGWGKDGRAGRAALAPKPHRCPPRRDARRPRMPSAA